jgi:hypothetical protein
MNITRSESKSVLNSLYNILNNHKNYLYHLRTIYMLSLFILVTIMKIEVHGFIIGLTLLVFILTIPYFDN